MGDQKWKIFGERLRAELTRRDISYREIADKVGLTLTTVSRYANSQRIPRATEILKLAEALGVTCDYMLGLTDNPYKTRYQEIASYSQIAPLTDKEQRIFLAAMAREEKVCAEVDRQLKSAAEPYEDSLVHACNEITRKVKGALWT